MDIKVLTRIEESNHDFDREKVESLLMMWKENFSEMKKEWDEAYGILSVLLPLKPDNDTILVTLLFPLYEKNEIDDETIRDKFGNTVLDLLISVKKLTSLKFEENDRSSQIDIFRKMFLVMAKDVRVILIGLARQLYKMHNLETLMKSEVEKKIAARESMDVYVPLASRLGIYRLKTDMEDISFKYLEPEEYKKIYRQLESVGKKKMTAIKMIKGELKRFLEDAGYEPEIEGRFKSVYSTYRKMKRKNLDSVEDLYDIFAMRVILPSRFDQNGEEVVDHLYSVLGMIHSHWRPLSRRFKDYIAVPKANGYRSLHTVVLGIAPRHVEKPVEIQIRSSEMHKESEYGISAHWIYKHHKQNKRNVRAQTEWIKILSSFKEDREAIEGLETNLSESADVFGDRIFVLTPKGEVKDLPVGSTPIDFAYLIHTDVGHRCLMAKVNGHIVSLDYELKNGDVIEIVLQKEMAPKLQWLSVVKTGFAKSKIKAYFSSLNRENNIKQGKRLINDQLSRLGKAMLDQKYSILKNYAGRNLSMPERENILEEVGKGSQLASDIIKKIFPYQEILEARKKTLVPKKKSVQQKNVKESKIEDMVLVGGEKNLPIKLASCCKPKYGNSILGYVTRGSRVTVHKLSCPMIHGLDKDRIISADWLRDDDKTKIKVELDLTVVPRVGLIRDITGIISDMDINVVNMRMKGDIKVLHHDYFTLELSDIDQFDTLLNKLENIEGVVKVVKV